eukprot:snap_masked-scaffold_1-processed-gene-8.30-mRNA-1 protein AED:1.00 eAED:1.00 QI:0/0/0/0/1/1/2/0/62
MNNQDTEPVIMLGGFGHESLRNVSRKLWLRTNTFSNPQFALNNHQCLTMFSLLKSKLFTDAC